MTAHFKRGPHLPVFQGCQGKERGKNSVRLTKHSLTHKPQNTREREKNHFKKKAQFRKESQSIETCKRRQNDIARKRMRSLLDEWNSTQRGTTDDTLTHYMFLQDNHMPPNNSYEADKTVSTSRKTSGAFYKNEQVAHHHNIKDTVKTLCMREPNRKVKSIAKGDRSLCITKRVFWKTTTQTSNESD